jgi:hypothetical protein
MTKKNSDLYPDIPVTTDAENLIDSEQNQLPPKAPGWWMWFFVSLLVLGGWWAYVQTKETPFENSAIEQEEITNGDIQVKQNKKTTQTEQIAATDHDSIPPSVPKEKPIRITFVEFANINKKGEIIDEFGSSFYPNLQYVQANVRYVLKTNANSVLLQIKIKNSTGILLHNYSSPDGYTFEQTVNLEKNRPTFYLQGWSNEFKGIFQEGAYTYEIWNNGQMLYVTGFVVNPYSEQALNR